MSVPNHPAPAASGQIEPLALPGCLAPEDVFLVWLLDLPDGADLAAAARSEIARIDRSTLRNAKLARLRDLFVEAACSADAPPRQNARRSKRKEAS